MRTKIRAERVRKALERVDIAANSIHGDKLQKERTQTMDSFRKGELKVLIATDVSARGIDIPNVEYVVNYDLPDKLENYVHRVGRTGRGDKKGQAVSFCSEQEKELLEIIEKNLEKPIQKMDISKKDYKYTLEISKDKSHDWRSLLEEEETRQQQVYGGKRRKRKK